MTITTKPVRHGFDAVDCYQPVSGGLRHLTDFAEKPADKTPVPFLCFDLGYKAGMRRRSRAYADCFRCKLEHDLRQALLEHQLRQATNPPGRDGTPTTARPSQGETPHQISDGAEAVKAGGSGGSLDHRRDPLP